MVRYEPLRRPPVTASVTVRMHWITRATHQQLLDCWLQADPRWTEGAMGKFLERVMQAKRPALGKDEQKHKGVNNYDREREDDE